MNTSALILHEELLPSLTWEQVDRQLRALAPADPMQGMITGWLSDLRAEAPTLAADALLKELLCITWAVLQTQRERFATLPPSRASH